MFNKKTHIIREDSTEEQEANEESKINENCSNDIEMADEEGPRDAELPQNETSVP